MGRREDGAHAVATACTIKASILDAKMWADNAPVIATDCNHWSSNTLQNCDFLRANKHMSRSYEQILISLGDKISANVWECKVDLGLITDSSTWNKHELLHVREITCKYSRRSANFRRSRSETKGSMFRVKRDGEPSRIPVKK